jgi:putative transposase
MIKIIRKVNYKIYPIYAELISLDNLLVHHHMLTNWALRERRDVYKNEGRSLNYEEQSKINTQYRLRRKEYGLFNANAQSEQVTLRRVQLAYDGFFRRIEKNEKAGFPRYKPFNRFKSWGYASHGDGWKLQLNEKKHGSVRISGVGTIKIRGKARNENGKPKTMEVIKNGDNWYISVSFEYEKIERSSGSAAVGIDWGVNDLFNITDNKGNFTQVENPRFLKVASKELKEQQQKLAKCVKNSNNFNKIKSKIKKIHRKVKNQRKDYAHQLTSKIVSEVALITTEELTIKNMTKSAKGTLEKHGKMVKQKSGLNREILNTAPAMTFTMLKYKAEEAGIEYVDVPTKKIKPSQRCPKCDAIKKKSLSERKHVCPCGADMHRDHAAGEVCLNYAFGVYSDGNRPKEVT